MWKWINYYQIQQFVYKNFILENYFLMISTIKEFIFKNQKRLICIEYFHRKNKLWFKKLQSFSKNWSEAIIRKYPITKNIIKILFFIISKFFLLKRVSFLTYDTADDIITILEIIEKLLFPETDFWHDNYLKIIIVIISSSKSKK